MRVQSLPSAFIVTLALLVGAEAFVRHSWWLGRHAPAPTAPMAPEPAVQASSKNDRGDGGLADPLTKASWYAVEAFGNIFGSLNGRRNDRESRPEGAAYRLDRAPSSLEETRRRLQADNQREYFLSGEIDALIYDENCLFSDPFVSFRGRDRFLQNLSNLGSFITEYSARPIEYDDATEPGVVTSKFMVKLRLNLPWRPVLAWPWGVRCRIDPATFLVTAHEESWDVAPLEGVQQIFRKPTTSI